MFPVLEPAEIGRLWRFGELKSYAPGDRIVATGQVARGAFVILAGRVDASQRGLSHSDPIVTHGPGSFSWASLPNYPAARLWSMPTPRRRSRPSSFRRAGCAISWWKRPNWANAVMRALILRRVGLLDVGAGGPVIVGSADHGRYSAPRGRLPSTGEGRRRNLDYGEAQSFQDLLLCGSLRLIGDELPPPRWLSWHASPPLSSKALTTY
jgi:thioredoxin reductase (NADPH)